MGTELVDALTEDVDMFLVASARRPSVVELERCGGRGAGREGSKVLVPATGGPLDAWGAALGVLFTLLIKVWSLSARLELALRLGLFLGCILSSIEAELAGGLPNREKKLEVGF